MDEGITRYPLRRRRKWTTAKTTAGRSRSAVLSSASVLGVEAKEIENQFRNLAKSFRNNCAT